MARLATRMGAWLVVASALALATVLWHHHALPASLGSAFHISLGVGARDQSLWSINKIFARSERDEVARPESQGSNTFEEDFREAKGFVPPLRLVSARQMEVSASNRSASKFVAAPGFFESDYRIYVMHTKAHYFSHHLIVKDVYLRANADLKDPSGLFVLSDAKGQSLCGGGRPMGWITAYCPAETNTAWFEGHLGAPGIVPMSELSSLKASRPASFHFVQGTTLIIILDQSCTNVAHFAGKLLYVHHVLTNKAMYRLLNKMDITNVIVVAGKQTYSKLVNSSGWHNLLLESTVWPHRIIFNDPADLFLSPPKGGFRTFVFQDMTDLTSLGWIHFEQLVGVGILKGVFFFDDSRLPPRSEEYRSPFPSTVVSVSYDSIVLRRKVRETLTRRMRRAQRQISSVEPVQSIERRVMLVDRRGTRRVFADDTKELLTSSMRAWAEKRGFSFEVISFEGLDAQGQVQLVQSAAMLVGLHGANLVNSMFMPPLAVLLEIFPYVFSHNMYFEGGKASIKYFSYQPDHGTDWPDVGNYSSAFDCVQRSTECKLFYRDGVVQLNETDLKNLENIFNDAFDYLDSLEAASQRFVAEKKDLLVDIEKELGNGQAVPPPTLHSQLECVSIFDTLHKVTHVFWPFLLPVYFENYRPGAHHFFLMLLLLAANNCART
ncbi:Protein O-linked-mannose beta-1,4-N-acetylglucosaminyltransferase 2 [Porphyridium purpureum]|uniref:Protein O-linked-mannose beta-1,4-N-acetylglucosaminyltransferase 2 n=1 Tax=Porphyridium purpureum TaxID=35688 RepID=A0A5J4YTX8_PORPP|nr:Protein O-linked-mannose beta-1,4-N-acetylglucosaminyltransferase 2 [Porphyridium purpureum]|eukprot:POR5325..scf229_5